MPEPDTTRRQPSGAFVPDFHALFEASPVGIAICDGQGLFVHANTAMGVLFGYPASHLVGRSGTEFVYADDLALHVGVEAAQRGSPTGVARVEARHVHPDGSLHWLELTINAFAGPAGARWTLFCAQDITRRKSAEAALAQSRAELAAIASISRSTQLSRDPRPAILRAARELSGAAALAMVESGPDTNLRVTSRDGAGADDPGHFPGHGVVSARSVTGKAWHEGRPRWWTSDTPYGDEPHPTDPVDLRRARSVLWQPVSAHGTTIAVMVAWWWHPLLDMDDPVVRAMRPIAAEAALALQTAQLWAELEMSAHTDPLTGTSNRRAWNIAVQRLADDSRRSRRPLTIALADLDHFKAYNDQFGHDAGDVLLRSFAQASMRSLRASDVFARWGGEEFILALPDTSRGSASALLHRVRTAVPADRTCSIGSTTWHAEEPVLDCINRADAALYDAKHAGRDQVAWR